MNIAQKEPVLLISAIALIIVTALAKAGVVLETGTVETIIIDGIIVISAILQRIKVTPTAKLKAPPTTRGP